MKTFEALCMPHRPELVRFALRLTSNRSLADDLVQETLMQAMVDWGSFRGDSERARRWLNRILKNRFIDHCRHRMYARDRAASHQESIIHAMYDQAQQSADVRVTEGMGLDLLAAFAELDPKHQEVIRLADISGASYREIAEELDVPLGTVMSRLSRARAHMRDLLGAYTEPDSKEQEALERVSVTEFRRAI